MVAPSVPLLPSQDSSSSINQRPAPLRPKHKRPFVPSLAFYRQNWFLGVLLLMSLSLFALSAFFLFGFEFDEGSPSPANAAPTVEGIEITYVSVIKLMHERTRFQLHSHEVPNGIGSGQQSVTGFSNVDDSNSYWTGPRRGRSSREKLAIKELVENGHQ